MTALDYTTESRRAADALRIGTCSGGRIEA